MKYTRCPTNFKPELNGKFEMYAGKIIGKFLELVFKLICKKLKYFSRKKIKKLNKSGNLRIGKNFLQLK